MNPETSATRPTFVVAGAGRSGTTGLVEGLRTHPRVFVTQPKEPHYFALHGTPARFTGPGDDATINRVAVTDRSDYLNLYPSTHDYVALGDGSVSTLYYADKAAPELLRINPDMRVVLILRDPVARAFSSYSYMRARGFEPCEDFLEAVADESRRQAEGWHHLWHYTAMSYYAHDYRTLRDAVGPDHIGVWFHDDLETDYDGTVTDVLRFIGAPPEEGTARSGVDRVNVSGTPRLASAQRAITWATRHEVVRGAVKRSTSFAFRERVRRTLLRPASSSALAREALEDRYTDDLRELAGEIDRPLPAWLERHR